MTHLQSQPLQSHLLAADVAFCKPDILNDQLWELSAGSGVIRAVSLSTSFGLRAKRFQFFPRFRLGDNTVTDPNEFIELPIIHFDSTNFINLGLKPFKSIDVTARFWVPESQVICGQYTFQNSSDRAFPVTISLLCLLVPLAGGSPMLPVQMGINRVLQGETSDLKPLLYMTGGPEDAQDTFPGLSAQLLLTPGKPRSINWVLASRESTQTSLMRARHYSASQLDEVQLTIEMRDKQKMLKFDSGDPSVQACLYDSQRQALQLLMPGVAEFDHATYVKERNTDGGYLPSTAVLDLQSAWSGQTVWDTWLMMQNLLPGNSGLAKGLIENHFRGQSENGTVDMQLNAMLRPTGYSAPPLLNTLVLELSAYLDEPKWLYSIFPRLSSFLNYWVFTEPDEPSFSIRGWQHPLQTGFAPISSSRETTLFSFIPDVRTPDDALLLSMLYRELKSYQQLAHLLEQQEDFDFAQSRLENVTARLRKLIFDAQPALESPDSPLFTFGENGKTEIKRRMSSPCKLSLRIVSGQRLPGNFRCVFYGSGPEGKVREELTCDSFTFLGDCGVATTSQVFSVLEAVRLDAWPQENTGWIQPAGGSVSSITRYMPALCGVLTQEEVDTYLASNPLDPFLGPDGLRFTATSEGRPAGNIPRSWAMLILDGLIRYGKFDLAETIFTRQFINSHQKSRPASLDNLIPMNLYLKILGVKRFTNKELILTRSLNQHAPVTVQYKKISVSLEKERVIVDMGPDGQLTITSPGPHHILFG